MLQRILWVVAVEKVNSKVETKIIQRFGEILQLRHQFDYVEVIQSKLSLDCMGNYHLTDAIPDGFAQCRQCLDDYYTYETIAMYGRKFMGKFEF